ncbi:glycosyltransferase [Planktomarina temperata]|nr:glycosyltransferase [Planktomarina temperata]
MLSAIQGTIETIVFIYNDEFIEDRGGVQNVSVKLAQKFKEMGKRIIFLSTNQLKKQLAVKNDLISIHITENIFGSLLPTTLKFLDDIFVQYQNILVINQAALGGGGEALSSYFKRQHNAYVYASIHNSPLGEVNRVLSQWKLIHIKKISPSTFQIIESFLIFLYRLKRKKKYEKIYSSSDCFVVLHKAYIDELRRVMNSEEVQVRVITNPFSFENVPLVEVPKENIILFLGRLENKQKRVNTLIDIWARVCFDFPNWRLVILGHGPDAEKLKRQSAKYKMANIEFVGAVDPHVYLRTAKVLCLTSAFEGTPMVIPEAQFYGVLPICMDNFSAAGDMLNHGKCGILVSENDQKEYEAKLRDILSDEALIQKYSDSIKDLSEFEKVFDICKRWLKLHSGHFDE